MKHAHNHAHTVGHPHAFGHRVVVEHAHAHNHPSGMNAHYLDRAPRHGNHTHSEYETTDLARQAAR